MTLDRTDSKPAPRRDHLDRAVDAVRGEPIDADRFDQARERVRARLTAESSAAAVPPPESGPIRGCADVQALLPAFVAGELPTARALLVEDHARHCPACRRALAAVRRGERPTALAAAAVRRSPPAHRNVPRWLPIAAVLALAVLAAALFLPAGAPFGPPTALGEIESVDGELLHPGNDGGTAPWNVGATFRAGDPVRTARGSHAVLRLADGSRIEMGERAELAVERGMRGTTLHLDRGRIIVQAAKQRRGKLYVTTGDCLVSVTGTIFSVNHGVKGSRVSVIEGEVKVAGSRGTEVLHPGEQMTTSPSLERVPVAQEIAWSRDRGRYLALLAELSDIQRELHDRVPPPALRHDSRLLDLAPTATVGYLALPNVSTSVSEAYRIVQERLGTSPVLHDWWQREVAAPGRERLLETFVEKVRQYGGYLGDEVVIAFPAGVARGSAEPLVVAEVTHPRELSAALAEDAARIAGEGHRGDGLVLVRDPASLPLDAHGFFVWVGEHALVATPSAALLRTTAELAASGGKTGFAETAFGGRLTEAYGAGVEWLFAADLEQLVHVSKQAGAESGDPTGVSDVQHLVVERHEVDGKAETRAFVTFRGERRGVVSWLAAPAPMGALDFVSPEANLVVSFVVRDPADLLGELLSARGEGNDERAEIQHELGIDLVDDLAAPLGGEVTFALDGPVLPAPSWKVVAEVYDPVRLEATIEKLVERSRADLQGEGTTTALPELVTETAGGRTYHTLRGGHRGLEIHYLFADGYLVAAPSRALLDRALEVRASGQTLTASETFRQLLPADGQVNFSGLFYQNLAPLAASLASLGPGTEAPSGSAPGEAPSADLRSLLSAVSGTPATLGYAYGEPDRIVFAATGPGGFAGLDLLSLLRYGGLVGLSQGMAGAVVR